MATDEVQTRVGRYPNDHSFLANRNDLARRYLCRYILYLPQRDSVMSKTI